MLHITIPYELWVKCPKCNAAATAECMEPATYGSKVINGFHAERSARLNDQLHIPTPPYTRNTGIQYHFPTLDMYVLVKEHPEFIDVVPMLRTFSVDALGRKLEAPDDKKAPDELFQRTPRPR